MNLMILFFDFVHHISRKIIDPATKPNERSSNLTAGIGVFEEPIILRRYIKKPTLFEIDGKKSPKFRFIDSS